jgi:hypothetical protein
MNSGLQNDRKPALERGDFVAVSRVAAPRRIDADGAGTLMSEALVTCDPDDFPRRRGDAIGPLQHRVVPGDESDLFVAAREQHPALGPMTCGKLDEPIRRAYVGGARPLETA